MNNSTLNIDVACAVRVEEIECFLDLLLLLLGELRAGLALLLLGRFLTAHEKFKKYLN
jgi:hypothetical protein